MSNSTDKEQPEYVPYDAKDADKVIARDNFDDLILEAANPGDEKGCGEPDCPVCNETTAEAESTRREPDSDCATDTAASSYVYQPPAGYSVVGEAPAESHNEYVNVIQFMAEVTHDLCKGLSPNIEARRPVVLLEPAPDSDQVKGGSVDDLVVNVTLTFQVRYEK